MEEERCQSFTRHFLPQLNLNLVFSPLTGQLFWFWQAMSEQLSSSDNILILNHSNDTLDMNQMQIDKIIQNRYLKK